MLGVATMLNFACDGCGSVSVILPLELVDTATVRCSGCGREHGCWAQFKERVERIISADSPEVNVVAGRVGSRPQMTRLPPAAAGRVLTRMS
jgi:hypothetical protein